jgi:hypothetical protein
MGEVDAGEPLGHRQERLLERLGDPVFRPVQARVLKRQCQCGRSLLQEVHLLRCERHRLAEAVRDHDAEDLAAHDQRRDHQGGDAELLHDDRVDPVVMRDVVDDEGCACSQYFH